MREPENLVSVQVVTECKIIKDKKLSRRTAKKKLVMEELTANIVHVNTKSPQVSVRKESEEVVVELPELSAQIGETLHLAKKEDVRAKISKKGKQKKSFGVSQTVITSGQRKEAEVQSAPNLGDRQEEKEATTIHMAANKRGAKKAFAKSATMVMECQAFREIEKPEPAQFFCKWKERWRRFCWSPVVVTGFNNTSSAVLHQTDMMPLKERLQRKESNFVERRKLVPKMVPKKAQENEETIMAPKKRWEKKALGEDIEEKRKREGGGEKVMKRDCEKEESLKRDSEKEKSLKGGWKEKAKDGECYVPPSA